MVAVLLEGLLFSHMVFADDSYLYCRATAKEVNHILTLLDNYEKASGNGSILINLLSSLVLILMDEPNKLSANVGCEKSRRRESIFGAT